MMIEKNLNCLYCGKEMESKSAKKKFCCPLHKSYWHRENEKPKIIELPVDFIGVEKLAIISPDRSILEVKDFDQLPEWVKLAAKELFSPTNQSKTDRLKSIKSADKVANTVKDKKADTEVKNNLNGEKPINLDELKKLMPPGLDTFERSSWIAEERQKYNI